MRTHTPIEVTGVRLAFADGPLSGNVAIYGRYLPYDTGDKAAVWKLLGSGVVTVPAHNVASSVLVLNNGLKIGFRLAPQLYIVRTSEGSIATTPVDASIRYPAGPDIGINSGEGIDGLFGSATHFRRPNVSIIYKPLKPIVRPRDKKRRITTASSTKTLRIVSKYATKVQYRESGKKRTYRDAQELRFKDGFVLWKVPLQLNRGRKVVRIRALGEHGRATTRVIINRVARP